MHRITTLRLQLVSLTCTLLAPLLCFAQQINTIQTPNILLAAADLTSADRSFNRKFGDEFLKEYWGLYPDRALAVGYFAYAGELVIPDEQSRARELGLLNKWLSQLHRFNPESLSPEGRGDWALLNNRFETQRWAITDYRDWEWNPAVYNVGDALKLILVNYPVPAEQRLRAVLKRLEGVSSYYRAAKANISNPTHEHTQLAIEKNGEALKLLSPELEKQAATSQLRDNERAMLARRIVAAREAIADYIAWLETLDTQLQQGNARSVRLGSELYEQKFSYAFQSGTTAAELHERALKEKQALHERMEQLAEALWPKYFPDTPRPDNRVERIDWVVTKLQDHEIISLQSVANRAQQAMQSTPAPNKKPPTNKPLSPIRTFFGNPALQSGWEHYSELTALENGFGGTTPEAWLMYTMSSLRSVCDALLDYGVHAQNMSEEEAVQLLVEEAFEPADLAREKYRKAQLSSVQLAGEFAVYSEIVELRAQLKREMNSSFDVARFNSQFLNYNRTPVKVIKELMGPALLAQSAQ